MNDIETQRDLAEALLQLKDAQGALAIMERNMHASLFEAKDVFDS